MAITYNGRELSSGAVINSFSRIFPENEEFFSLRCFSSDGSGDLEWRTREVSALPSILTPSLTQTIPEVTVAYQEYTFCERQDIYFSYQPWSASAAGYYTCLSQLSGYEAEVYATFTDPLWEQTSPSSQNLPLGAEVVIRVRYADASVGYMNLGSGFTYEWILDPHIPNLPDGILVDVGRVNIMQNTYEYTFRATFSTAGIYSLRGMREIQLHAYAYNYLFQPLDYVNFLFILSIPFHYRNSHWLRSGKLQ